MVLFGNPRHGIRACTHPHEERKDFGVLTTFLDRTGMQLRHIREKKFNSINCHLDQWDLPDVLGVDGRAAEWHRRLRDDFVNFILRSALISVVVFASTLFPIGGIGGGQDGSQPPELHPDYAFYDKWWCLLQHCLFTPLVFSLHFPMICSYEVHDLLDAKNMLECWVFCLKMISFPVSVLSTVFVVVTNADRAWKGYYIFVPFLFSLPCLDLVMVAAMWRRVGRKDWGTLKAYAEAKRKYFKDVQPIVMAINFELLAVWFTVGYIVFDLTILEDPSTPEWVRMGRGLMAFVISMVAQWASQAGLNPWVFRARWDGNRLAYPHRTGFRPVSPCHVTSDAQSKCHTCPVRCTVMSDAQGHVRCTTVISDAHQP